MPSLNWRLSVVSGGAWKVNFWRRAVKMRKSSVRASTSPRQARFPVETATHGILKLSFCLPLGPWSRCVTPFPGWVLQPELHSPITALALQCPHPQDCTTLRERVCVTISAHVVSCPAQVSCADARGLDVPTLGWVVWAAQKRATREGAWCWYGKQGC